MEVYEIGSILSYASFESSASYVFSWSYNRMLDWIKNGIFIAVVAHGLIGISLVWDKILLRRPQTSNLINYIFWLGAISVFGLALIPFGFYWPPASVAILGFLAGILELVATFFYYAALKRGEASGAIAVMGGFSPVATVLFGELFLPRPLARHQVVGFVILVVAGFIMFFAEHFDVNLRVLIPRVAGASVLMGFDNVLQKIVFNRASFVPGFVFLTLGTFAAAMFLLLRSSWRQQIFSSSEEAAPKSRFWYFVNRFMAGLGSFLVFYAISLANPAVVDAMSGIRYAVVFLGVLAFTKLRPAVLSEDFHGWVVLGKTVATLLVGTGLALLAMGEPEGLTAALTMHN